MADITEPADDPIARVRAAMRAYSGHDDSPEQRIVSGLLDVCDCLDRQQQTLTDRLKDFTSDDITRQFRFQAVQAWRLVMPHFTSTILWTRRLAITRDVVLMTCGITIALLVWWRPTIDINAAATQCAQNQTVSDGGVYCTMRVWVKPPVKGKE